MKPIHPLRWTSRTVPGVAFETGGVNWGKDLGAALGSKSTGHPLGGSRRIEVACLDGQEWKAPATFAPQDSLALGSTGDYLPLLHFDGNGNLWMAFKRRFSPNSRIQVSGGVASRPSIFWETYLTRLDGSRWTDPIPLPNSWNRNSTRLGLSSSNWKAVGFLAFRLASRPLSRSDRSIWGRQSCPLGPTAHQL